VEIVLLVPAIPEAWVYAARQDPARRALFDGLEALGCHPGFRLAGIAVGDGQERRPTYVHAKLMIVDDVWTTIGSCNLHANSLSGQTEMNASIWDAAIARDLRRTLFAQHLGRDTASLDDVEALRLFQRIADDNWLRSESGDADWQGEAFTLAPQSYAVR
jgi:phosphatidylserine/phosphatidylglycerophosphate/cardiolipin synthase-like enzyme